VRRVAINTGGGDAPGLNAVIEAAAHAAHARGLELIGIRKGYDGLLFPERYLDGGLCTLTPDKVERITHLGGTILRTTNRGNALRMEVGPHYERSAADAPMSNSAGTPKCRSRSSGSWRSRACFLRRRPRSS